MLRASRLAYAILDGTLNRSTGSPTSGLTTLASTIGTA
jgi:hypothetical protein